MTFIREKRIGDGVYLYEVRSYRDPITGKVRQRYIRYIGKADKDTARPHYQHPETKEKRKKYWEQYRQRPEIKKMQRQYNQKPEYKERKRRYLQTPNDKFLSAKHQAKRSRELGYTPLNTSFHGSTGHHIDRECVIYIPKKIHIKYPHRLDKPETMYVINAIAFLFLHPDGTNPASIIELEEEKK